MAMSYDRDTAIRVKNFLLNAGLTLNGAYGLMANIYCESGFRSANLQNSYVKSLNLTDEEYTAQVDSGEYTNFVRDSAGYGICQWTFWSRKEALYNYCKSVGTSIGDETMQLEYLILELEQRYPTVINLLRTSNDERECAIRVMLDFERPANKTEDNQKRRADYATELKSALDEGSHVVRLALDAGHGYDTPGKRCIDENETREWYLNDRVMDKLENKLTGYNCEVLRTDDTTGVVDIELEDRVNASNNFNADYFISVHHNAGANGTEAGGTVVYHYCNTDKGIELANLLYQEVVAQTGLAGNRSSHVIKSAKYVLENTDTYAFLIENGFMDSALDLPIILTDEHAEKTADGILEFLIKHCGLVKLDSGTEDEIIEETEEMVPEETIPEDDVASEEDVQYFPASTMKYLTLESALKSCGIENPDFEYRVKVAAANAMPFYEGRGIEEKILLLRFRVGELIKPKTE